jgi:hypothetical protein
LRCTADIWPTTIVAKNAFDFERDAISLSPRRYLSYDSPVLADYDAIRMGMNLDRTPDRTDRHRVSIVVEAHQAGFRDRCRHRVEFIEPAGIEYVLSVAPSIFVQGRSNIVLEMILLR